MANKLAVIEVDGRKYQAKYVGKGSFSKVYRIGDRVIYYTRGDCGKEALAMYQYDQMTHMPELIRHDNINSRRGTEFYVFSSPYYRNVKSTDKSAWVLMNFLINEHYKFLVNYRHYQQQAYGRVRDGEQTMLAFIEHLREETKVPKSVTKALFTLYELARNCGDKIGFDLKKSNFGINEYGTLIFRDVIWV